ncbi:unnamed protein product [Ceratitis capitata]|uniref:(Mediterranean fruit fly) hypothetical protein n=1 Tax=Ceratitis capitata TaxID=7213 RepID=A0A811UTM4_CERCA|nr:unnamed protein product [Ceratitis capitata]
MISNAAAWMCYYSQGHNYLVNFMVFTFSKFKYEPFQKWIRNRSMYLKPCLEYHCFLQLNNTEKGTIYGKLV